MDTRIPGIALTAGAVLAVFAIAHHPTAGGADFIEFAKRVERLAGPNQAVHGTMLALMAVATWALIAFAIRRGITRSLVLLGVVAWAIGFAAMEFAGLFNGFVIVAISRRALAAPASSEQLRVTLQAMNAAVAVVAGAGAIGMSAAIACWSADLTREDGSARWVGWSGLAAGTLTVLALVTGSVTLDVGGMLTVLAVWAAWFVAVGTLMIVRRV